MKQNLKFSSSFTPAMIQGLKSYRCPVVSILTNVDYKIVSLLQKILQLI